MLTMVLSCSASDLVYADTGLQGVQCMRLICSGEGTCTRISGFGWKGRISWHNRNDDVELQHVLLTCIFHKLE